MTVLTLILATCIGLVLLSRILARQAEMALPPAGDMQAVTGGTIHYVETGRQDAQTVVMIHGLAGNLHHFTYGMVAPLAQDFRVIALDRPGCGYSLRDTDDQAHLQVQARMIWEFLDARDVTSPVLVGHSLGGAVALAMALERPHAVGALALLCPATQPQSHTPDVFRPLQVKSPLLRRALAHTVVAPTTKLTRKHMLKEIFAPDVVVEDFQIKAGGIQAFRPQTFISASADLMGTRADVRHLTDRYATDLHAPGAILFAQDDMILSPDHHGAPMAQFGLPMQTLPGHGHMIPVTAPDACCDFVRQVARQAKP
ncbi:alpha/beta hydrolase [Shimia sp.]|uniref:alpha/beta fold hydrolase n=1 Tax=Shimia sp. TaxID=1954381 RepID=UPI0032994025